MTLKLLIDRLSDWLLWNKLFEAKQISKLWEILPTTMLSLSDVWLPGNSYNNEHRYSAATCNGWYRNMHNTYNLNCTA